jgi:hypothetical protein
MKKKSHKIKKAPLDAGPKSREETPSRSEVHRIPNRSLDGCKITTHGRKFDMLKTKFARPPLAAM